MSYPYVYIPMYRSIDGIKYILFTRIIESDLEYLRLFELEWYFSLYIPCENIHIPVG